MSKLRVGNVVLCRFYNTPDKRFYGELWQGIITAIDLSRDKPYTISRVGAEPISLRRKEIKRIVVR